MSDDCSLIDIENICIGLAVDLVWSGHRLFLTGADIRKEAARSLWKGCICNETIHIRELITAGLLKRLQPILRLLFKPDPNISILDNV